MEKLLRKKIVRNSKGEVIKTTQFDYDKRGNCIYATSSDGYEVWRKFERRGCCAESCL